MADNMRQVQREVETQMTAIEDAYRQGDERGRGELLGVLQEAMLRIGYLELRLEEADSIE